MTKRSDEATRPALSPLAREARDVGGREAAGGEGREGESALGKSYYYAVDRPSDQAEDPLDGPSRAARLARETIAARIVLSDLPAVEDPKTGNARVPFDRLHFCGRPTSKSVQYAMIESLTGHVTTYTTHKTHCDLGWVCPSCMSSLGYQLYLKTDKALKGFSSFGPDYKIYFATLTLRPAEWRSLADLTAVITSAFTRMMDSKPLRELRKSGYLVGWMRFLEFTTGTVDEAGKRSGHHPHLHVALAVHEPEGVERTFLDLWNEKGKRGSKRPDPGLKYRWCRSLNDASRALDVWPLVGAHPNRQDVQLLVDGDVDRLTGYLSKEPRTWSIGKELARGDLKSARLSSMSPTEVLRAAAEGNAEASRWFRAYASATRDVYRMTQSEGYDGVRGRSFTDWAGELYEAHQRQEALIARGIGDSERARANREALEGQLAHLDDMTDEEYDAYEAVWDERERQEAAVEKVRVRLFDFSRLDELEGDDGHVGLAEFHDPRLLLGLEQALRGATSAAEARQIAEAYIEEHHLPVSMRESVRARSEGRTYSDWRTEDRRAYAAQLEQGEERIRARLAARYPSASDEQLTVWTQDRIQEAVWRRFGRPGDSLSDVWSTD